MKKFIIIALSLLALFFLIMFLIPEEEPTYYYLTHPENEPLEGYEIEHTGELFVINHEEKGVSFFVPGDWTITEDYELNELEFTSPNHIKGGNFPESGCLVRSSITNFFKSEEFPEVELRPDIIRREIEEGSMHEYQEAMMIGERDAVKTLRYSDSDIGNLVFLEMPINDTIAYFGMTYPIKDKEFCNSEFNKIIDSVVIK